MCKALEKYKGPWLADQLEWGISNWIEGDNKMIVRALIVILRKIEKEEAARR